MNLSPIHSSLDAADVRPFTMTEVADYSDLSRIGINISERQVRNMMSAFGMDSLQNNLTTASILTPVQFLQTWLPGFVRVLTAARKIDELVGIDTIGAWEDEEAVQGILENTGFAVPYGDLNNVPLSNYNANFERRTFVRFESGMRVGNLEEARAAKIRLNSAQEKRESVTLALEIQRNAVGFYGYNNGANRTYGFLNDPNLPAYVSVAASGSGSSTLWSQKTFLNITADIREMAAALQNQSQDNINPEDTETTLALATIAYQYLSVVSDFGISSVREWIKQTYPKMRIVSAPQLNGANGGANVMYLYANRVQDSSTDNGKTFQQLVASKFQMLGVERKAKGYEEDYSNATAGVLVKRPFAIVRRTGI